MRILQDDHWVRIELVERAQQDADKVLAVRGGTVENLPKPVELAGDVEDRPHRPRRERCIACPPDRPHGWVGRREMLLERPEERRLVDTGFAR